MRKNKLLIAMLILTVSWLSCVTSYAATQSDPVGLLQYVANNMIAGLKAQRATLKTNPKVVYNLAYKFVVPYADLPAMSKNVLSPARWNAATPAQRTRFQHEFTTTVIRTYASALTSYDDQKINFYPVRGGTDGKHTLEVSGQIVGADHEPINVSYRLIKSGSAWRLYDMSVEGVDMLESFRAQFADILANGSMDQLLSRMATHNTGG